MAGKRRRPGSHHRPLAFSAIAVTLVGLLLISLRLVPGSPLGPAADTGQAIASGRSADTANRSTRPQSSPSPSLEPLPFTPQSLDDLDIEGWYGWSVLDKRTGKIIGSKNMTETSTTASMVKSWIVADYLRRTAEAGQTPSSAKLADATKIIRDSDNVLAQRFYNDVGRSASIKRLIKTCGLTDSKVSSDGGWSETNLSPRDTARLGLCIDDGRAAGPKWTDWLLNEMRLVRGAGDFGIRKVFPAKVQKTIAIKNGWIDRPEKQEMHVSCMAIGDTWTMGVMVRAPLNLGWDYAIDNCQKITEALLRPAT
ncbi:hypothetical protein ABZ671_02720 [Micromonospora sp. NPDC006766]|uniref:hypothetical protein n=1 Tax=Micromonospora sp. NPDC006766 TaxID=3154778 RepID=UPI00340DA863